MDLCLSVETKNTKLFNRARAKCVLVIICKYIRNCFFTFHSEPIQRNNSGHIVVQARVNGKLGANRMIIEAKTKKGLEYFASKPFLYW